MNELVLGIDGGGTQTAAMLAQADCGTDDVRILGRGRAGPSNWQVVGREPALAAIRAAVHQAFDAAALQPRPVRSACLGLAGADRPRERLWLERWASEVGLAESVRPANDGELVLAAGFADRCGVAVISGTGSFAYGRSPDGRTARAGGWGYLFGDEGSGYSVALAGLRAVACAADGRGTSTAMTERFLECLGIDCAESLVHAVYGAGLDRAAIAALAPLVFDAAEAGDAAAADLVADAGQQLALAVFAVARRLGWTEPVPLALGGGLLRNRVSLVEAVRRSVAELGLRIGRMELVTEPAIGAVRLACLSSEENKEGRKAGS